MVINRKPLVALATAGLLVSLAACGGGSGSSNNDATAGKKGGTLRWLTFHTNDHMDPQRTYVGVNISNFNRKFKEQRGMTPSRYRDLARRRIRSRMAG